MVASDGVGACQSRMVHVQSGVLEASTRDAPTPTSAHYVRSVEAKET